jgi:hypothetical protein
VCKLFIDNEAAIRAYCEKNGLDFEKAKHSPKTFGKEDIYVQHYNEEKGKFGLLDETPMPIMLKIFKTDNGLAFEQTEHTAKYLAL